jgi:hypothetical protein
LYSQRITTGGLPALASLSNLEELILYDCNVSEADLKTLMEGSPNLDAKVYYTRAFGRQGDDR